MSKILSKGLTFDDVLLVPAYSEVTPDVVDVTAWLTPSISLNIPLVSAAMDTVTESAMAISMARAGGIGIVHKNMSIERQKLEIEKVKKSESGMIIDPITVEPDGVVGLDGDGIGETCRFRGFLDLFDLQLLALDAPMSMRTMPMPPARAMEMAIADSVTVSIAAETSGIYSREMDGVQPSGHVHHIRRDFRIGGHQQHIIEGQAFAQNSGHRALLRTKTLREVAHTGGRKCER